MSLAPFPVLFEDNHLLVVVKPAGLPTIGVAADRDSLVKQAKKYVAVKYNKPGNVYLGVMSRLDALVSGIVVLARTSKSAARLTLQFREGEVEKLYWAIVEGVPDPPAGDCLDWLRKDESRRCMVVAAGEAPPAKRARLHYRSLKRVRRASLLEVRLETGRKHQIRVQLSSRGWPIVGDRKYGARTRFPAGIGLHARQIRLARPGP